MGLLRKLYLFFIQNFSSSKKVSSSKNVSLPKKFFNLKNLTYPKKVFERMQTLSRIMKVLEHFFLITKKKFSDLVKFLKIYKVKIQMQFFFISCKLEFIFLLESRKTNLKGRNFRKENSFFRIENCGKFSGNLKKLNAL